MPSFTFNFPAPQASRLRNALCAIAGFTEAGDITDANARQGLLLVVRRAVEGHEYNVAQAASAQAAQVSSVDLT